MHKLHDHQSAVKSQVYQAIHAGNRRVIVKAATAFGKTVLAASIIHDAISKGVEVVFCVPTLTLIDQTLVEFTSFGLTPGVIQADHMETDYARPVQIASIQTIASRLKRNNKAEMFHMKQYFLNKLVIVDEAHLMFAAQEWLNENTNKPVIGLSATPWAKGLGEWYDTVVNGPSVGWLIENGYLSQYRAFSHFVPDMKGVAAGPSGDFNSKESGNKYTGGIIGDIVKTWELHAKGLQTILFAPRVVDAERFAAEFCAAGYSAVAVSGYMDNDDCRYEVDRFRKHEIQVICSVAKLTTGFDVKDVGAIVDCQPTKSLMRHVQKLGRGLRVAEGKDEVILIDNAGNLLRNGLPDGDFPDDLDSADHKVSDRKEKEDPLPKECPKCHFMKPPKVHKCPSCAFEPEKKSALEVEAGELVELTKTQKGHNRNLSREEKAAFFGGLKKYAYDKGFSQGWASHKYKAKMGVWPNAFKNSPMVEPNAMVMGHIQSQNIAYANRPK